MNNDVLAHIMCDARLQNSSIRYGTFLDDWISCYSCDDWTRNLLGCSALVKGSRLTIRKLETNVRQLESDARNMDLCINIVSSWSYRWVGEVVSHLTHVRSENALRKAAQLEAMTFLQSLIKRLLVFMDSSKKSFKRVQDLSDAHRQLQEDLELFP